MVEEEMEMCDGLFELYNENNITLKYLPYCVANLERSTVISDHCRVV